MSDDLISRKAVIDYLREQNNNVIIEKHKDGFISQDTFSGMESAISAFRNFILTLTTAFDKEKVIDELKRMEEESCKEWNEYGDAASLGKVITFAETIEIVEKGGLN